MARPLGIEYAGAVYPVRVRCCRWTAFFPLYSRQRKIAAHLGLTYTSISRIISERS
jgi:hypothetical protein